MQNAFVLVEKARKINEQGHMKGVYKKKEAFVVGGYCSSYIGKVSDDNGKDEKKFDVVKKTDSAFSSSDFFHKNASFLNL